MILVYVTTVNNSVYAFDANDPYASEPFWHVNFGTPPNVYDGKYGCSDMNGNMGIIGTPVIDAQEGTLYVVAATRVGDAFSAAPARVGSSDRRRSRDEPGDDHRARLCSAYAEPTARPASLARKGIHRLRVSLRQRALSWLPDQL